MKTVEATRFEKILKEIRRHGCAHLSGFITKDCAEELKLRAEKAWSRFKSSGGSWNNNSIYIANAFSYDKSYLDLTSNKLIYELVSTLIGDTAVLLTNSLINVKVLDGQPGGIAGGDWHTDSRYIDGGKKRIAKGFTFLVFVLFEDWDERCSTIYIPKSHHWVTKPDKSADYEALHQTKKLAGAAGDVFILDGGIWHKAGNPLDRSRWGMVSLYGPWFVKPYFDFSKYFSQAQISDLSDIQLNLFHFTSNPPESQISRPGLNTLVSPSAFRTTLHNI